MGAVRKASRSVLTPIDRMKGMVDSIPGVGAITSHLPNAGQIFDTAFKPVDDLLGGVSQGISDEIGVGSLNTSGMGATSALAEAERQRLGNQASPLAGINANQSVQDALAMQTAAATGQVPSVAALQQKAGLDSALAAQMAAANSARGGPGAQIAAQRNAMQQGAAMQQSQVNQAAQLRAAEMANARNALSSLGSTTLGMQTQDQNNRNSMIQNIMGMENQAAQNTQAQANSLNEKVFQAKMGALGGALNAGGSIIGASMMSDKRGKKDVRSGDSDIDAFLKKLSANKYEYKDPKNGKGTFVSPMAQELEKSSIGKQMVKNTPEGKMVQYDGHAMGSILASLAHLNDKIDALSGKKGRA